MKKITTKYAVFSAVIVMLLTAIGYFSFLKVPLDSPLPNKPCNVVETAKEVSIKRNIPLPSKVKEYPNEHDLAISAKIAYLSLLKHVNITHRQGDKVEDFVIDRCEYFALTFSKYSALPKPPIFSVPRGKKFPEVGLYMELLTDKNIYCLGPDINLSPTMDFKELEKNLVLYRRGCRTILPQIKYKSIDLP